jgi:hypothetical protein
MQSEQPVLICYSRSGGTLLNRILGSLKDVIVLSEVNPWGSFKPMLEQAQEWFRLINAEEKRGLEGRTFAEQIGELQKRATEKGKTIIIRDWSTANFMKGLVRDRKPSYRLETMIELGRHFSLKPVVLMRDPYSTWKSNSDNFGKYFDLSPESFFCEYRRYLASIQSMPRIKLEELTYFPREHIRWICEYWNLTFSEKCLMDFYQFVHCTGDNTLARPIERGAGIQKVSPEPWPENLDQKTIKLLRRVYSMTSYNLATQILSPGKETGP